MPESINEELLAIPEKKIDTCNSTYGLEPIGKFEKLKEEEEDEEQENMYPAPELFSTMLTDDAFNHLNFQYSLGTGGAGHDWVVNILINFLYYI